jgi:general secretion pathway protein H
MPRRQQGFTLLEIMLVLLLMGLAAGYVLFNTDAISEPVSKQLEKQARRLQVIVDIASDFAVLNQQEIGLYLDDEEQSYTFMYLDEDDNWQLIDDTPNLARYTLPEPFIFEFTLEDLPWQNEDSLFTHSFFESESSIPEDGVEIGKEEDKPLPTPQIMLMSSGEITPFSITFSLDTSLSTGDPVYYILNNHDMPPFELVGPLEELP